MARLSFCPGPSATGWFTIERMRFRTKAGLGAAGLALVLLPLLGACSTARGPGAEPPVGGGSGGRAKPASSGGAPGSGGALAAGGASGTGGATGSGGAPSRPRMPRAGRRHRPTPRPRPRRHRPWAPLATPACWSTTLRCAFIRDKVKSGAQPWKAAFDRANGRALLSRQPAPVADVECGPYSMPNLGCAEELGDAGAAWNLALNFAITGEEAFAKKAIEIMNAWARVLESHSNHNAPLQAGWSASLWPRAGELIRHYYPGWPAAEVSAFATMLREVYLPLSARATPAPTAIGSSP